MMAKKTATEGVYVSDEVYKMYQQMCRTLMRVAGSFTEDSSMKIEGLTAALVSIARGNGVSKEKLIRAVELVYDNVKKQIDN